MSLTYRENKSGPKLEPWGTPEVGSYCKDVAPHALTDCFRPIKYDFNHLQILLRIPRFHRKI